MMIDDIKPCSEVCRVTSMPLLGGGLVNEAYVSADVETDVAIPGTKSMLSFVSATCVVDKTLVLTFTANLEALLGPRADHATWNGGDFS
jgi:hypothetical protein